MPSARSVPAGSSADAAILGPRSTPRAATRNAAARSGGGSNRRTGRPPQGGTSETPLWRGGASAWRGGQALMSSQNRGMTLRCHPPRFQTITRGSNHAAPTGATKPQGANDVHGKQRQDDPRLVLRHRRGSRDGRRQVSDRRGILPRRCPEVRFLPRCPFPGSHFRNSPPSGGQMV